MFIAHADYPDDVYEWQKDVDLHQVLWSRSRLGERQKGQGITGADHFWFGHTPLRHRVDIGNLHYIDTGAVFGGETDSCAIAIIKNHHTPVLVARNHL
ncbi:serine/threonine protein phosphatase 1 [Escherichia coli]|uniref:Serine/threonine protein phosphatase 1 n=1 Tax=Escherichia coli TaxID=562 RepID=A0A376U9F8_ECOLX|nr:serine/threonine protein phosphatase 1 [Escherichia coli]